MNSLHTLNVTTLVFNPHSRQKTQSGTHASPKGKREGRGAVTVGFIPRGSIRSQIQLDKVKRYKNTPLRPATITYSQFPQRKMKSSLQRLSAIACLERPPKFNFQSEIPREHQQQHNPEKQLAKSCLTLSSHHKFMRYSLLQQKLRARTLNTQFWPSD